jgi:ribosomal-protein-alanine N-acetyltransferase
MQYSELTKTKRFYLKEIQAEDITFIHKGLSDPEVTKYYAVHFSTLEDTKEQMEWYANLKKTGTGVWWGIYDKHSDEFLGAGGYNDLETSNRKAEIGFWLLKAHWGKGILKEVMPSILEIGFQELNLLRVEGFVDHENVKCKKALEKVNFTLEGTMRSFEIKDGVALDVDIYSMLCSDWDSLKN